MLSMFAASMLVRGIQVRSPDCSKSTVQLNSGGIDFPAYSYQGPKNQY